MWQTWCTTPVLPSLCGKTRPIYFVTSMFISSPAETVLRYDPTAHARVPVRCPKPVKSYNAFMGGTDKNDQRTKLHKGSIQQLCANEFLQASHLTREKNSYIPQLSGGVIWSTCGQHNKLEPLIRPMWGTRGQDSAEAGCSHDVIRPEAAGTNNRCAVCRKIYLVAKHANPTAKNKDLPKRTKTVYKCTHCDVLLCIGDERSNSNHWFDWHHKVEYWHLGTH